jgi:hypothetical protein
VSTSKEDTTAASKAGVSNPREDTTAESKAGVSTSKEDTTAASKAGVVSNPRKEPTGAPSPKAGGVPSSKEEATSLALVPAGGNRSPKGGGGFEAGVGGGEGPKRPSVSAPAPRQDWAVDSAIVVRDTGVNP